MRNSETEWPFKLTVDMADLISILHFLGRCDRTSLCLHNLAAKDLHTRIMAPLIYQPGPDLCNEML